MITHDDSASTGVFLSVQRRTASQAMSYKECNVYSTAGQRSGDCAVSALLFGSCHCRDIDSMQPQEELKLRHLTLEIDIAVVEQDYPNLPPVVLIHHACACVDEVLHRQARARRNARVRLGWDGYGEACLDDCLPSSRDICLLCTAASTTCVSITHTS